MSRLLRMCRRGDRRHVTRLEEERDAEIATPTGKPPKTKVDLKAIAGKAQSRVQVVRGKAMRSPRATTEERSALAEPESPESRPAMSKAKGKARGVKSPRATAEERTTLAYEAGTPEMDPEL